MSADGKAKYSPTFTGALVAVDGTKRWFINGQYGRANNGPSVEYSDGGFCYYLHPAFGREDQDEPLLHRLDGPAVKYADGSQYYYQYGVLHRDIKDGPAVIHADGVVQYWLKGKQVSKEELKEIEKEIFENSEEKKSDSEKDVFPLYGEGPDFENPDFPIDQWKSDVESKVTFLGYFNWLSDREIDERSSNLVNPDLSKFPASVQVDNYDAGDDDEVRCRCYIKILDELERVYKQDPDHLAARLILEEEEKVRSKMDKEEIFAYEVGSLRKVMKRKSVESLIKIESEIIQICSGRSIENSEFSEDVRVQYFSELDGDSVLEHPEYTIDRWIDSVMKNITIDDYCDWVEEQRDEILSVDDARLDPEERRSLVNAMVRDKQKEARRQKKLEKADEARNRLASLYQVHVDDIEMELVFCHWEVLTEKLKKAVGR